MSVKVPDLQSVVRVQRKCEHVWLQWCLQVAWCQVNLLPEKDACCLSQSRFMFSAMVKGFLDRAKKIMELIFFFFCSSTQEVVRWMLWVIWDCFQVGIPVWSTLSSFLLPRSCKPSQVALSSFRVPHFSQLKNPLWPTLPPSQPFLFPTPELFLFPTPELFRPVWASWAFLASFYK